MTEAEKAQAQLPMWCDVHNQMEYGPGGAIGAKDHRQYDTERCRWCGHYHNDHGLCALRP